MVETSLQTAKAGFEDFVLALSCFGVEWGGFISTGQGFVVVDLIAEISILA